MLAVWEPPADHVVGVAPAVAVAAQAAKLLGEFPCLRLGPVRLEVVAHVDGAACHVPCAPDCCFRWPSLASEEPVAERGDVAVRVFRERRKGLLGEDGEAILRTRPDDVRVALQPAEDGVDVALRAVGEKDDLASVARAHCISVCAFECREVLREIRRVSRQEKVRLGAFAADPLRPVHKL